MDIISLILSHREPLSIELGILCLIFDGVLHDHPVIWSSSDPPKF